MLRRARRRSLRTANSKLEEGLLPAEKQKGAETWIDLDSATTTTTNHKFSYFASAIGVHYPHFLIVIIEGRQKCEVGLQLRLATIFCLRIR
jgi:hypothetical protein